MPSTSSTSNTSSFVTALAVFVVSFLLTARASAQTITVSHEASLQRVDPSGQLLPKRSLQLNPEAINAQDCREDQRIRFPIRMSGFQPNARVQMWAAGTGSDCTWPENRRPDTGSCWMLPPGDVPLQQTIDVDVPVRAILSPTSDEKICRTLPTTAIDVQIMMFDPANDLAVVSEHVQIVADTLGPEPPHASVSPGNGRARIEIRSMGALNAVNALVAYCERSAAPDTCSAAALVPGSEPDPTFECGSIIGNTGSTFFTNPLENGSNHVVAVAARDTFGNLGPLSSVACTTPSPDAETRAGSLDEPTGCAIGAASPGRATGASFAAGAFGVLALAVARRRRAASPGC